MTDTRAAFEAWYGKYPHDLKKHENGRYFGPGAQDLWETWQAAINHERSECAKVCEEVDEPGWTGYECPNTFNDGKWAAAAAIRARSEP
jgi:hypothetical protein